MKLLLRVLGAFLCLGGVAFPSLKGQEISPPVGGEWVTRPIERVPLNPGRPGYQRTERGPHHERWERQRVVTDEFGEQHVVSSGFTRLGGGMNYWDDNAGGWRTTQAEIEPNPVGAAAMEGPHKVVFRRNLNQPDAIHLTGPDGQEMRSSVLGIAYVDPVT